uniref:Gustatory receptor n=1 Tax=Anopheles dirus TaxID=7168 RepID=A0A182NZ60_9DIPT
MAIVDRFSKVIIFYQLLALHWFNLRRKWVGWLEVALYVTLNFSLITALLYWIYHNEEKVIFTGNWLGYVVDLSKYLLMVFTHYSLFLESGLHGSILRNVWRELDQIVRLIPRAKWARQQRAHLVTVGSFLAYISWWELTFAYYVCKTDRGTTFTVTFWILFTLLHLRQLQILLYTNLLGFCLATLNAELGWTIELSKGARRYGGRRSDGQICGHLHTLMDAFARTERLLDLLNHAFGYSFTIIKLINHFYILTDTYWIVNGFIGGEVFNSLYLECCLSSKLICLMLNLHSNERILIECRRIQELLHRVDLGWQLRCDRGWHMVQNFLLRLRYSQPFAVTALSMFRMDYSVMMEIAFNVTASISLFIQASG